MGYYFNPPQLLPQKGRKLTTRSNLYGELVAQLQPGEKLMGHYDRGMFQNAVHLYSQSEFDGFEDQVKRGIIIRLGFYALNEEDFAQYVG
ncbi:MAG: hypothetical protein WA052_01740 [Microgenomates group bacterium]